MLLALSMILSISLMSCSDETPDESNDTSDTVGSPTDTAADTAAETEPPETKPAGPTVEELLNAPYSDLKYGDEKIKPTRVTVHDPSIVYDHTTGEYYIFGSHRAWAKSSDLVRWKTFTLPSIDNRYNTIFKENVKWSTYGNKNYDVSGNMWAPDVIYNADMGKWCMYMSINGDNHYSSIVMLTADSINGKYTYEGTVVYSGFLNKKQAEETDFKKVTGNTKIARYISGSKWNSQYGPNAIDPCVFYDKDGQLWMSYGSWFGGIFLLRLDNNTGLRDYETTYETKSNVSDEYFGHRISGGYGCTGEGSYIVWDRNTGYYYLYMSYCGLNATDNFSGYHMRLFRSESVEGPYVDAKGNSAICTKANESQADKGIKLFGNYYFESLKGNGDNSNKGYMSPGHNSAFIDSDGQHYLIYHTRFNLGNEWHAVRVHQQFMNEDGWPVTAVYEHQGSVIKKEGYTADEIVGDYEFIDHGLAYITTFTPMLKTLNITLNSDGTITGDVEGTWEQRTGEDGNGYYATMTIKNATYKGIFFKQYDESSKRVERMTFSLIGDNNKAIWGSKVTE